MPEVEPSALEDFISSSASKSSNPDLTASLSSNIFEALLDYVNQSRGLPSPIPSQSNTSVVVFVDGLEFAYQLTEDDLVKVFARYGTVSGIAIGQDGTSAMVTFASHLQASRAVSELNGKRLGGLASGCLRVIAYSWGGASSSSTVPLIRKYTCRFDIQIENDKEFHVARRIIGQKGSNMKRIVKQAGYDAKLRLRGRGSGFLEGAQKQESQEPLHLCVSCKDYNGYRSAIDQVEELLGEIYHDFHDYCRIKGQACPRDLGVVMHEHPLMYQPSPSGAIPNYGGDSPVHGMAPQVLSPPLTPEVPLMPPSDDKDSQEIESLIDQRNEARRVCNFKEADRIRDLLRQRGIGLMDEPGGRGRAQDVTSWRFWR